MSSKYPWKSNEDDKRKERVGVPVQGLEGLDPSRYTIHFPSKQKKNCAKLA